MAMPGEREPVLEVQARQPAVVVAAGLALPPALATGVIAGLVGATIAGAWLASGSFDALLLILVAFGAGAIAIRQLTISVAQLRAAREELARAAVDQERLRFARDLHDLLGHSLSLIIIKSELARRLLPASPAEAAAEVSDDGRGAAAGPLTPGSGLSGLAERAATHGAELRVGPRRGRHRSGGRSGSGSPRRAERVAVSDGTACRERCHRKGRARHSRPLAPIRSSLRRRRS